MLPPLHSYLADALPSSVRLLVHHVESARYASPALFSAPPGELSEPTTAESHLLSVSIRHNGRALQVFALEVYVYETASLTTIFVSKADSTGYLHLLSLPTGTPSPIKAVTTAFLEWLVKKKRRIDTRLLLSLFARAQNQYLFPGSIVNNGKHVLDDRQLIRWWCRVLDPILLRHGNQDSQQIHQAHARLVIPGLDSYETRSYFPKAALPETTAKPKWSASDPLPNLGKANGLPPRCYIPRFPDDPKARFVLDLDDELPNEPLEETQGEKGKSPGIWKSVKSLTQFWELMAFRQECSAGRLVGFIWIVFEPIHATSNAQKDADQNTGEDGASHSVSELLQPQRAQETSPNVSITPASILPLSLQDSPKQSTVSSAPMVSKLKETKDGPAKDGPEKVMPFLHDSDHPEQQENSPDLQISLSAYKKLLLELDLLDYASLDMAFGSTEAFIRSLSRLHGSEQDWSKEVVGNQAMVTPPPATPASLSAESKAAGKTIPVNVINTLSVKRKKQSVDETPVVPAETKVPVVNVLSSTIVRKKPKV